MGHILMMLSEDVILSFSFTGHLAPVPLWWHQISTLAGEKSQGAVGSYVVTS